ncbi:hypothetical protein Tco_1490884 [Tanacetum coccineum]
MNLTRHQKTSSKPFKLLNKRHLQTRPHMRLERALLPDLPEVGVDPAGAVPEIASVTLGEVSTRVVELVEVHERDIQDVYALLEDAQDGDSIDGGRGGLCFPRGLGSFNRIESGHPLGASDPS